MAMQATARKTAMRLAGALVGMVLLTKAGQPARANEQGKKLWQQSLAALHALTTLTADMTRTVRAPGADSKSEWRVQLKKPNFVRLTQKPPYTMDTRVLVSDGKVVWDYSQDKVFPNGLYRKTPADPQGRNLPASDDLLQMFFGTPEVVRDSPEPKALGKQIVAGKTYDVIEFRLEQPAEKGKAGDAHNMTLQLQFFLDRNKLPMRAVSAISLGESSVRTETVLNNLRVNVPIPKAVFSYRPPKDAHPFPTFPAPPSEKQDKVP